MGVYEHILVGVDGSDASAEAATMAGRLAADLDAKVTAVYVRQLPTTVPPFSTDFYLDSYWEEVERLAGERTAEALDPLGASWRFEVRTGDPAVQLQLSADEHGADLIVVGARGHSVAHRLLLGSVSTRLVHHAHRPVLVVR
jgi:nucleotide-binding universal stress UspA family protein